MFKSIRWKFIIIYFGLVFIAMAIIGVFIIQQFEDYNLNAVSDRLHGVASDYILPEIQKIPSGVSLEESGEELQSSLESLYRAFYREEIFIIDTNFKIIATNSYLVGENALYELEERLITKGLEGEIIEADKKVADEPTKNIVFPIVRNGEVEGLLYMRDQLKDIYDTLDRSKKILTQATALALGITIILGYLIAKSVTGPINDLTKKASKMAKGDFDQRVEVKSDDEIGELGEMFNYLTGKLKITLGEISREKSKMETILNYMADGLIAVNLEGKVIHVNPKALDMLQLQGNDILNSNYNNLFKKLNNKLTLNYITNNNEHLIGSENVELKNSTLKINYAPFKNEEGENGGIVLVIQDITEQQNLENMRREFVANVSHELKTPLTSIKSYTETLLSGMLDKTDMVEKFLNVINSEADRMTRLVRDLLQLSNFDYSHAKLKKKEYDLVELIEQSVVKMEMTAEQKEQEFKLVCDSESMTGYFDYDRVEQVILNIISNAIKYTHESGQVIVSLYKEGEKGVIKVSDNGMGIPKEDLPRIFERFYRVEKARTRSLGGTGLGLSIASEIIKAHDGTIEINSEVEKGTEVIIKLPLEEEIV